MRIAAALRITAITAYASSSFAAAAQPPPSGPKAMPEMIQQAERDDRMASEERAAAPDRSRSRGLFQYDLDSAYLPDTVGGYLEIVVDTDSATVSEENDRLLREIATLLKERNEMDIWVTAQLETDSPTELRETALAVQSVVEQLLSYEIEDVPYRIWHPNEKRPETPLDVLEIRVVPATRRPPPIS